LIIVIEVLPVLYKILFLLLVKRDVLWFAESPSYLLVLLPCFDLLFDILLFLEVFVRGSSVFDQFSVEEVVFFVHLLPCKLLGLSLS